MHVQIYGTRTVDDALALVDMGVDHLGLELEEGCEEQVAAIMKAVAGRVTVSLLPLFDDLAQIVATVRRLQPEIVHLCSNNSLADIEPIREFARQVAPAQVMLSIPVAPPAISDRLDSLALARAFDPIVDYLLLDTTLGDDDENPVPGWVGVTGKTHDWRISQAIVAGCRSPVILAGGLDPDNVAEAIRSVQPWGIDACTGLDLYRGRKDLARCRAFIERARRAERSRQL